WFEVQADCSFLPSRESLVRKQKTGAPCEDTGFDDGMWRQECRHSSMGGDAPPDFLERGSRWKFQISPCSVPDPQHGKCHRLIVDFVNDPVGADDEFPETIFVILRNDSADSRKSMKRLHLGYNQVAESFR